MVGYSCARHTAFLCRSLSQVLRGHAPFFNFLCLHPVPGTSCAPRSWIHLQIVKKIWIMS